MDYAHDPVMVREVLELLMPRPGGRYLDGTLGGGGHAERLLEMSAPRGQLLGLDRDDDALAAARTRLQRFGDRLITRHASFVEADAILKELGWQKVHGILLDLGLSSHQLKSPERGFSFQSTGRLDMRMDRRQPLDAFQVVNEFPAARLERILRDYGEEPQARRIALAIDAGRKNEAIVTTRQLADLVQAAVRRGTARRARGGFRIHPATRTFQAIRIAVNGELENLEVFLRNAYELLWNGGRMVVISFHSLEDRLVKRAFRQWSRSCLCPPRAPVCGCGWSKKARLLTPKPLVPSMEEIRVNPRARSARLRAVESL